MNEHVEISGRVSRIYSDGYVDRAFTDLKSYFLQGNYVDENTIVKAITFGVKEKTYQSWAGLDKTQLEEARTQNPYTTKMRQTIIGKIIFSCTGIKQ